MEGCRRGHKGDIYGSREASRRRSLKKKPPRCSWQPTVPSWEKAFCKVVGSLDWETILDMKKFAHLYDNVVRWNDSAGEEAFNNAKKRFLANIRGLPCDIALPNPDLYIDEINWDSEIDPELLLDLECKSLVPNVAQNYEPVIIFGDALFCNDSFSPAGWGEFEENPKGATNSSPHDHDKPWDESLCDSKQNAKENEWGESGNNACPLDKRGGVVGDTGWDVGCENSWCSNYFDSPDVSKNPKGTDNIGVQGTWDVSNGKKDNGGRFAPRYNTSRFNGNDHHSSYKWRNVNDRKRDPFVYEQSNTGERLPSRCWNLLNSCGPVSYQSSDNAGQTWNLKKPVS